MLKNVIAQALTVKIIVSYKKEGKKTKNYKKFKFFFQDPWRTRKERITHTKNRRAEWQHTI